MAFKIESHALGASLISLEGEVDESSWASVIGRLAAEDGESVAIATFIHTLLDRNINLQDLLGVAFEQSPQTRAAQLEILGEALELDRGDRDSFRQPCLYLARDRFDNDPHPGVVASARWLLIRLGDREWLAKQIEARMTSVGDLAAEDEEATQRLRINTLGMFMVTFPPGTIAATEVSKDASDQSVVDQALPYAMECSSG